MIMTGILSKYRLINNLFKSRLREFLARRSFSSTYRETGSVYIHWPYCKQRCSYCNFVKFVPKEGASWSYSDNIIENGMIHELESILDESPIKIITSVFFGGGTPSLARPHLVEAILDVLVKKCSLSSNLEVTLEANPTSLETKKLTDFQCSGINRLSLGVQSLDDELLSLMNRDHSVDEALMCVEEAKKIFPNKVSVDMIFAFPGQSLLSWKEDMKRIAALSLDHVSLYQLTLERGTKLFKQVKAGQIAVPDEDESTDMYEFAVDFLAENGISRYEVSNFARHRWSESTHNKAVWQGSQYVGIGPGAHSRLIRTGGRNCPEDVREARINAADPRSWLMEVQLKGNGARKVILQSQIDVQMEYIATSLRTSEGALQKRWSNFAEKPLRDLFPPSTLDPTYLTLEDGRLKATPKGLNVLDSLLPNLINIIAGEKLKT